MCEQVCLFMLAYVVLDERVVIHITLTIVKYITEVICKCKPMSGVYMLKHPEIPACGYVKVFGSLFEWEKKK